MALMTWSSALSVGVESMDDQHKKLLKLLHELNAAMATGKSSTILKPLLTSLVEYTRFHFGAEEALLMREKYPKLAAHRGLHKDLTKQVEDYVHRLDAGEIALSVDLMDFLQDWLKQHIQQEDRAYGQWLNEHGVR